MGFDFLTATGFEPFLCITLYWASILQTRKGQHTMKKHLEEPITSVLIIIVNLSGTDMWDDMLTEAVRISDTEPKCRANMYTFFHLHFMYLWHSILIRFLIIACIPLNIFYIFNCPFLLFAFSLCSQVKKFTVLFCFHTLHFILCLLNE